MRTLSESTKVTLTLGQLKRLVREANEVIPLEFAIDDVVDQLGEKKEWFKPVVVNHGRKFRGNCYIVGSREVDNGGFAGNGARPLSYYTVYKGWDPAKEEVVSFNEPRHGDLVEWKVDPQQRLMDMGNYIKSVLQSCILRCGEDFKYRMFYLRKVLGISTEMAEELANASKEYEASPEGGKEMADEDIQMFPLVRHNPDGRREYLITFKNTDLGPMDVMYRDTIKLYAKDEKEAVDTLRHKHPEYEVIKIRRLAESEEN